MRSSYLASLVLATAFFSTSQSYAQQPSHRVDMSGYRIANDDSAYYRDSPLPNSMSYASGAMPVSYDAQACACAEPSCNCEEPSCGCEQGGCGCGNRGWCDKFENCSISELMGLKCCSNWEVGGWTELGYTDNNVPLSQAYNDLLSFGDVPDNVNLNQQWFYVGKKTDGSCGCDWGGRFDMIYGTDAQKTQAFGNPGAGVRGFGTWDASFDDGQYGWAMPQAYGEFAKGDLTVKVGHFFTLVGYEVVPATGNFFYTHSYTFFNSEPFTHTGVLASYKLTDKTTIHGGWVLGWDTGFDQLNSGNAFHGGFIHNISDDASFAYMATAGNFGWRDGGSKNSYQHSAVLDLKLCCDWEYVLQSDYCRTDNPGVSEFDTIGACNYVFYNVNDKTRAGTRAEWWKADGVSFYEVTAGVNFKVVDNVVFRPEWRQDWAPGIGLDEDTFAVDMVWNY